jgi:tRNA (guanine-N7-)-methyltransferase
VSDPGSAPVASPPIAAEDLLVEAEEIRERGLDACLGSPHVVLEIGFGRAEVLIDLGLSRPDRAFLGVEVSRKRAHKAARRLARAGVGNARVVHGTAEYLLERVLPEHSVSECWINFPDPWPKKRHHKRRLIRPDVVPLLARALAAGALLHLATDHEGYAEEIDAVLSASPLFANLHAPEPWSKLAPERRRTAYEEEFLTEGRRIAYFDYRRASGSP